jgi:hypothetical protein
MELAVGRGGSEGLKFSDHIVPVCFRLSLGLWHPCSSEQVLVVGRFLLKKRLFVHAQIVEFDSHDVSLSDIQYTEAW